MENVKVASSWSSGKDSCFACFKAKESGFNISYIMNFISQEFQRVSFHGVVKQLVKMQVEAIGCELIQTEVATGNGEYEKTFRQTLRLLKTKGINTLICGDIFLLDCRNWVEMMCEKEGMKAVEPLWMRPSKEILKEFIDSGFKAIVTATQDSILGKEWVGREVNHVFLDDLEKAGGVDICGENGEYHTFVFDGPIFKKKIEISQSQKVKIGDYWFLDIKKYDLISKGGEK